MSRAFHFWHSQPLDRGTLPWLANPRPPAMSPPTPSRRDLRAERQARREGAHALEKPEPLYAKPGGTHVRWTCRNIQKLNKTQVPNVQRPSPINTTNTVKHQKSPTPTPHKHYERCKRHKGPTPMTHKRDKTNTLNATKRPARTPHKGYKPCVRHKRPTKTLHKQHRRCKRHKTFTPNAPWKIKLRKM